LSGIAARRSSRGANQPTQDGDIPDENPSLSSPRSGLTHAPHLSTEGLQPAISKDWQFTCTTDGMRHPFAAITTLLFTGLAAVLSAQSTDLTGYWRDDAGGNYQIRQVGNNIYWINDGRPNYINVLFGTMEGSTVRGSWSDLPDSRSQGNGTLVLRVESRDRIVRISSSGSNYSGSVLTRIAGTGTTGGIAPGGAGAGPGGSVTAGPPANSTALVGTWTWFDGRTILMSSDGTFREDKPMGLTGKWQLTDAGQRLFTLVWSHGYTDHLNLSADGSRLSTVTKLFGTRTSSVPPPTPSDKSVIGTWTWFLNGPVSVYPDGTFRQPQSGLTGRWGLADPARRLYVFTWSHGYRDELILSTDGNELANSAHWFGRRLSDVPDGAGGLGPGGIGGDACSNPNTMAIMDEWLSRAIPPQVPGAGLRYEAWGRMVGSGVTGTITAVSPPDTNLDRCHWLWRYAAEMRSSNNMGTLQDYLRSRGIQ